ADAADDHVVGCGARARIFEAVGLNLSQQAEPEIHVVADFYGGLPGGGRGSKEYEDCGGDRAAGEASVSACHSVLHVRPAIVARSLTLTRAGRLVIGARIAAGGTPVPCRMMRSGPPLVHGSPRHRLEASRLASRPFVQ